MPPSHWNPSVSSAGATGIPSEHEHQQHAHASTGRLPRPFFYPKWVQKLQMFSAQQHMKSMQSILNMGLTSNGTRIGYPEQLLGPENFNRPDFNAAFQGVLNGIMDQMRGGEHRFGEALQLLQDVGRAGAQRYHERHPPDLGESGSSAGAPTPSQAGTDLEVEDEAVAPHQTSRQPERRARTHLTPSEPSAPEDEQPVAASILSHEEALRAYSGSGRDIRAWQRGLDVAEAPQEQFPARSPRTGSTAPSTVADTQERPPALPRRHGNAIDAREQEEARAAYDALHQTGVRNALALAGTQSGGRHRNNWPGSGVRPAPTHEVHHHHGSRTSASGSADGDGGEDEDDEQN